MKSPDQAPSGPGSFGPGSPGPGSPGPGSFGQNSPGPGFFGQNSPGPLLSVLVHLRWHYQVFILSGGYLFGGVLAGTSFSPAFLFHFAVIHLLLFGGATLYNSWFDKDEGPIGGLADPPALPWWSHPFSLVLQGAGALLSAGMGMVYMGLYALSVLTFWAYSRPGIRWKGHPWLSLLAIGLSTGTNSVLFGYLAAGGVLNAGAIMAAVGAAGMVLSLYPVSQMYQLAEDRRRGDRTFAGVFGLQGVRRFFVASYVPGVLLSTGGFWLLRPGYAVLFLLLATVTGLALAVVLARLQGVPQEYNRVMRIKYATSMAFVLFMSGILAGLY